MLYMLGENEQLGARNLQGLVSELMGFAQKVCILHHLTLRDVDWQQSCRSREATQVAHVAHSSWSRSCRGREVDCAASSALHGLPNCARLGMMRQCLRRECAPAVGAPDQAPTEHRICNDKV